MTAENIFIQHERWNEQIHPLQELRRLQLKGNAEFIKKYFTAKAINASSVRQISTAQAHKCNGVIKNPKIKQIFKEKGKKLRPRATEGDGYMEMDAKSCNKSNTLSEDEEEVEQYLNFEVLGALPTMRSL